MGVSQIILKVEQQKTNSTQIF